MLSLLRGYLTPRMGWATRLLRRAHDLGQTIVAVENMAVRNTGGDQAHENNIKESSRALCQEQDTIQLNAMGYQVKYHPH